MKDHHINRRSFLKTSGCGAMGALPFLSTWLSLNKLNAAAADAMYGTQGDYRALVCLLFDGGNDSFNMLVPRGNSEYQTYARTRSNLALPQNSLLPISTTLQTGLDLGIHPIMTEVQDMYNQGKLAFLSNVGTLVEPTSRTQWNNSSVRLPQGLFSHSDQMMQWQTSVPQTRTGLGWGGRMADLLHSLNDNDRVSMNISLSGNNVFQVGNNTIEFTVDAVAGARSIEGYGGQEFLERIKTQSIDSMLAGQYQNIFERTYANTIKVALAANEEFSSAVNALNPFTTRFSSNPFSANLELVAKAIAARDDLGMKRQVFFISVEDWDHHDEVINAHANNLGIVSKGLGEFMAVLEELNISDCVTTFSISDFARTLSSNGNGSDHGWGGNVMVMGGAVKGGEVYGVYPELALDSNLDVGGGVLIPTTSTDEYFAELALWMGVTPSELTTVLPNITNFYSPGNSSLPIGFMNI